MESHAFNLNLNQEPNLELNSKVNLGPLFDYVALVVTVMALSHDICVFSVVDISQGDLKKKVFSRIKKSEKHA